MNLKSEQTWLWELLIKILAVLEALLLDLKYFLKRYFILNEAQACAWLLVNT